MGNEVLKFLVIFLVFCYGVGVGVSVGYDGEDEDWRKEMEAGKQGRRWRPEEPEGGDMRRRPEEPEGGGDRRRWPEKQESGRRWPEQEEEQTEEEEQFLMPEAEQVVRSEAGEMRVVRGVGGRAVDKPMHIGFITMEPKSLFVPQYLDSNLIIFVRRGEAKVGLIYKDELGERRLKSGDVYRIPAGSPFYLVNTGEGQRLHIICSIDTSESLGLGPFQSFFIGGGAYPQSVLSGFDLDLLTIAFNVTRAELRDILSRQQQGPIVYVSDQHSPSLWSKFLQLKNHDRLQEMTKMVDYQEDHQDQTQTWSWRKLLHSLFTTGSNADKRKAPEKHDKGTGKSPDSYNLYDRKPDFRNAYGWSMALDESDYKPLKHSGIGVYLVNLTAGSMMAPHVNPTATEYGIVLKGAGTIQIVYPNGTTAVNAKIQEGDVFLVPKYFPFCQIASRTGPLEFFGFTTSARKNRPQFLVGAASVLQSLKGPELAAAFGVSEDRMRRFVDSQREAVILPTAQAAPPHKEERKPPKEEEEERRKGEGEKVPPREGERVQPGEEEEKQPPREGGRVPEREDERGQRREDERRPPREDKRKPARREKDWGERVPEVIKTLGNDMFMGFD